jgi:hypothetical protein
MFSEQQLSNPTRTRVLKDGVQVAMFTNGARTVPVKGQMRTLNEIDLPLQDSFNRTRSSNWSAADFGGVWQHVGGNKATDYFIAPQQATMRLDTTGQSRRSMMRGFLVLENADFNFGFNTTDPDGGHQLISALLGYTNVSNHHLLNLRIRPANVWDSMGGTLTGTWGSADSGQAWSRVGGPSTDYSMSGGVGRHSLSAVNSSRRNVIGDTVDTDLTMKLRTTVDATGGSIMAGAVTRFQDFSNNYSFRVRFNTTGGVDTDIQSIVEGVVTTIASIEDSGLTYAANDWFNLRVQMQGNDLRMKVWADGDPEPGAWTREVTDNDLTDSGRVGTRSILSTDNTNTLPVIVEYDDFYAVMDDQSQDIEVYASKIVEGVSSSISSPTLIPLKRQPGQVLRIRAQAMDSENGGNSTLRLKVWEHNTPEPQDWTLSVTDSEYIPGKVGIRAYASIHTLNLPIDTYMTDFHADGQLPIEDQPITKNDQWVRVLDQPFTGTVNYEWLETQLNNYKPDVIATYMEYTHRMPPTFLADNTQIGGDADYSFRHPNGDRQEGADWSEYMQIPHTYTCGVFNPRPEFAESLDCSGSVRMAFWRHGMTMSRCHPNDPPGTVPRVTKNIEEFGPGVRVIPYVPDEVPSASAWKSVIQAGDIVQFSAAEVNNSDPSPGQGPPESQIDHNGIYLGIDEQGNHRFASSRKSLNGPQISDVSGNSTLEGTGLYAKAFRAIRRF